MALIRHGSDSGLSLDRIGPRSRLDLVRNESHLEEPEDSDTCAVCLGDDGTDTTLMPCFHSFHGSCILKWVESNFTCPLCRQEIQQFLPTGPADTIMDEFVNIWNEHYAKKSKPRRSQPKNQNAKQLSEEITISESMLEKPQPKVEVIEIPREGTPPPVVVEDRVEEAQICFGLKVNEDVTPQTWNTIWNDILPGAMEKWMQASITFSPRKIERSYVRTPYFQRSIILNLRVSEPVDGGPDLPPPKSDESKAFPEFTLLNMTSGLTAGVVAASVTIATSIKLTGLSSTTLWRTSLVTYRGTIPAVGVFFTGYEHLKKYLFDTNSSEKSASRTFGERFLSATMAASVAHVSPFRNVRMPLRYGAFFGAFEGTKDVTAGWLGLNRPLNLGEVAGSAAVGGLFASALYYPTTRLVDKSHGFVLSRGLVGVNLPSVSTLYRGWSLHLVGFLPACVACSCGFEFARRYYSRVYFD